MFTPWKRIKNVNGGSAVTTFDASMRGHEHESSRRATAGTTDDTR